jgi:translation initiation factor 4E
MAEVATMPTQTMDNTTFDDDDTKTVVDHPRGGNNGNVDDDDATTVFHNVDDFTVKHPLANTWTLWFTKPPTGKVR